MSWNTPGAPVPPAPKGDGPIDARCRQQARPAELKEDARLQEQGWHLVGAYQGGWQRVVIRATASYDGMCRPRQYQDFVFVRGVFAGTLSPRPMESRTDGAIGRVWLHDGGRLSAEYVRYAAADALCCPSRTTTVEFELAGDVRPVVRPTASVTHTPGGSTDTAASSPLQGTHWRAIELAGKTLPVQEAARAAHLEFQPHGLVSGSDGCNRLSGTYVVEADRITFGQMAMTQRACLNPPGTEAPFRDALKNAGRFAIARDRLELFDAGGVRLAVFAADPRMSSASPAPKLAGTAWQLVRFQGGDGTTLTPDDRTKYTIEFAADGRLSARIDCNRGRGTWQSERPGSITLGPLGSTRAKCPPESLHDQIVGQWGNIRSYVFRGGHLFLALRADGGIYELEPLARPN